MNVTQRNIKKSIEAEIMEQFGERVVVEYVPDVDERVQRIVSQYELKFSPVYETDHTTGSFIHAIDEHPHYILIQDERNNMLDVMTAFHELQHLIDYLYFLRIVCNGDIEKLKDNPLSVTFNVYSEYSATLHGVKKYIECVEIDGLSKRELAENILESAKDFYWNFNGIRNRYQLLMHSIKFFGSVLAYLSVVHDLDISWCIDDMKLYSELEPIFIHFLRYESDYAWYETADFLMRRFVDGGALE